MGSLSLLDFLHSFRLTSNSGHLNAEVSGQSCFRSFSYDWYHYVVNWGWWKLLLATLIYFMVINFIFAALYYLDSSKLEYVDASLSAILNAFRGADGLQEAWFFSIQTMTTIGMFSFFFVLFLFLSFRLRYLRPQVPLSPDDRRPRIILGNVHKWYSLVFIHRFF